MTPPPADPTTGEAQDDAAELAALMHEWSGWQTPGALLRCGLLDDHYGPHVFHMEWIDPIPPPTDDTGGRS